MARTEDLRVGGTAASGGRGVGVGVLVEEEGVDQVADFGGEGTEGEGGEGGGGGGCEGGGGGGGREGGVGEGHCWWVGAGGGMAWLIGWEEPRLGGGERVGEVWSDGGGG